MLSNCDRMQIRSRSISELSWWRNNVRREVVDTIERNIRSTMLRAFEDHFLVDRGKHPAPNVIFLFHYSYILFL